VIDEQRGFERSSPRRRQNGQHVVEYRLEDVAQHDVREAALCLCGPR